MEEDDRVPGLSVRPKAGHSSLCSLCRDEVPPLEKQACSGCGVGYHRSCLAEFGQTCATPGCGAQVEVLGPSPLIVIRETSGSESPDERAPAPRPPGEVPPPGFAFPSSNVLAATGLLWVLPAIVFLLSSSHWMMNPRAYWLRVCVVSVPLWCASAWGVQALLTESRAKSEE